MRKSGLHIIFPELYVTDAEALGLRDLCIRRVREQRVLEACPILRLQVSGVPTNGRYTNTGTLQRLEELFDDSIYEANGFRMIENHKASCCADCARKRRGKNHEAQRAARSRGEPAPKVSGVVAGAKAPTHTNTSRMSTGASMTASAATAPATSTRADPTGPPAASPGTACCVSSS